VQSSDPETEDLALPGRHRAAPAGPRRVLLRLSVGAGTLVVVVVLAVLTAFSTGLMGPPPNASERIELPEPSISSADPTMPHRLDLDATRAERPTPSSRPPSPVPTTESAAPAPAEPPTPLPPPPPVPSPAPPAEPAAEQGEPCSTPGALAVTARGKPVVCVARGRDGEPHWRPA
jgi:hypothetical protein